MVDGFKRVDKINFDLILSKLKDRAAAGFSNPGGLAVMWWA